MKPRPNILSDWKAVKHRPWQDVLRALLATCAPNNPQPPAETPRMPEPRRAPSPTSAED